MLGMLVMSQAVQSNNVEVSPASGPVVSPSGHLLVDLPRNKMPSALLTALTNKAQPTPSLHRAMLCIVYIDIHVKI